MADEEGLEEQCCENRDEVEDCVPCPPPLRYGGETKSGTDPRYRRRMILRVSATVLTDLLIKASKGVLPKDVQSLSVDWSHRVNCFDLLVSSVEFKEVPEGYEIPVMGTIVLEEPNKPMQLRKVEAITREEVKVSVR